MSENLSVSTNSGDRIKRFRSPQYPSMNLQRAIERAQLLHAKAQQHWVGFGVLTEAWDLKSGSASAWSMAATLLYFDLLTDEGIGPKRKFKLTDIAIRIIRDADPDSQKRKEAIQKAAINPSIHRELWEKFGNSKDISDIVFKNYLTLDRKDDGKAPYSNDAAEDLIKEYKSTISFAGFLDGSDKGPQLEGINDESRESAPKEETALKDVKQSEKNVEDPLQAQKKPFKQFIADEGVGEKEMLFGRLSKETSYRLLVSGELGAKEIGKLIKLLEAQMEVLQDDDDI